MSADRQAGRQEDRRNDRQTDRQSILVYTCPLQEKEKSDCWQLKRSVIKVSIVLLVYKILIAQHAASFSIEC